MKFIYERIPSDDQKLMAWVLITLQKLTGLEPQQQNQQVNKSDSVIQLV